MKPEDIEAVLQSESEITLYNGKVFKGYIQDWVDALDQIDEDAGYAIVIIPDSGDLKGRQVEIELKKIASYKILKAA